MELAIFVVFVCTWVAVALYLRRRHAHDDAHLHSTDGPAHTTPHEIIGAGWHFMARLHPTRHRFRAVGSRPLGEGESGVAGTFAFEFGHPRGRSVHDCAVLRNPRWRWPHITLQATPGFLRALVREGPTGSAVRPIGDPVLDKLWTAITDDPSATRVIASDPIARQIALHCSNVRDPEYFSRLGVPAPSGDRRRWAQVDFVELWGPYVLLAFLRTTLDLDPGQLAEELLAAVDPCL